MVDEKKQDEDKKEEASKNEAPKKEETPKKEEASKEEESEVKVPKKFEKLVQEIEKMSVLELSELVKVLEEKFGVSAQAPAVAAPAQSGGGGEEVAEEKSSFNVELQGIGDKKIEVIKVVRDVMEKGLKEAKDLVDSAASSPQMIKEGVDKETAEELKKKFEAAGAKVELK